MGISYSWSSWLALGLLVAFAGWAIYLTYYKHKGMEFGKIMSMYMLKYPMSIFFLALILINMAEAGWSASITPKDETMINPVTRFLGHNINAFLSIVAGLVFVKELSRFLKAFLPPYPTGNGMQVFGGIVRRIVLRFFIFTTTGIFALYGPIANLYLIANGVGESIQLQLFLVDWLPWHSSNEYLRLLLKYGYTMDYDSWDALSYGMAASIVMTASHIGLVWWEAIKNWDDVDTDGKHSQFNDPKPADDKDKNKDKDDKDKNKDPDKPKDKKPSFDQAVKDLLTFVGIADAKVASIGEDIRTQMKGLDAAKVMELSEKLIAHWTTMDKLNTDKQSGTLSAADFETKATALRKEIRDTFEQSPKNGGFGRTLPKN